METAIDGLTDGEKDRVARQIINLIIENKASLGQAIDILDMAKEKLYKLPATGW